MSFLNRVGFATSTTGDGSIDNIGAAETGYCTPAEAGAVDGAIYDWVIVDGSDFEVFRGAYASSGPSISRDHVYLSKVSGTPGTSKLELSGTAKVYLTVSGEYLADPWALQPLGVPIPVYTSLWGTLFDALPPRDRRYRYILLTAGEDGSGEYNEGVLDGESVSGSAPLVLATALVNFAASPLDNQTVRLINTERRVLRAGSVGTAQNDALQNITGTFGGPRLHSSGFSTTEVFDQSANGSNATQGSAGGITVSFDASRVVRTDTETRAKNVGMNYVMRIY